MSSLSERAARGMMSLMAAQIWIMLSSYIIAMLLARSLGPALYGVYGIVYSVLLSVELIGRLGLPQTVSKLVAEAGSTARRVETTGTTLAIIVYAGSSWRFGARRRGSARSSTCRTALPCSGSLRSTSRSTAFTSWRSTS